MKSHLPPTSSNHHHHHRHRVGTPDTNNSSASASAPNLSKPQPQPPPIRPQSSNRFSNHCLGIEELPPSSPCSGEQAQQQQQQQQQTFDINDNHDSISGHLNKESCPNAAAKNPKMSLENLMLPFDQQVHTAQVPATIVKQEKVVQIVPSKNRSTESTASFFTPHQNKTQMPAESATSLFANYSFGHNVAHASPLHATTSINGRSSSSGGGGGGGGGAGPLNAYYTHGMKSSPAPPPPLCTEPKAKRPWTESEDLILRELVSKLGTGLWAAMAQQIPGRTGKQVRERWLNHLSPGVTKRPWSAEEDNVIIENHKRIGNCWSRIAKLLQGRSDNSVKNRYYTTLRRRIGNTDARTTANSRKRYHVDEDAPHKRPRVWE